MKITKNRFVTGKNSSVKFSILFTLLLVTMLSFAQISITTTTPVTQNFNSITSGSTLPANWKLQASTASPTWSSGAGTSTVAYTNTGSPTAGGTYIWGNTGNTDTSVGAMTSGSFASPNNLMAFYVNSNANPISALAISYNAKKYRTNTAAASVQFFYSLNGSTWTAVTAGDIAAATIGTGASAYNFGTPTTYSVGSFNITGLNIPNGSNFYLRWNINTTGASSQAIGIDDVSVTPTFSGVTVNGTIAANEYGVHTNGSNQQSTAIGGTWYMSSDATNLYIGISGTNTNEGAVLYLDKNPISPVNGGTNADGSLVGYNYDGSSFANLQFRADLVVYFKDGYREYRTSDGSGGWSATPTTGFGSYASASGTREIAIPWSAIGGQPAAYNWFGYVAYSGGGAYASVPTENPGSGAGLVIGSSARWSRYYTVSTSSTLPFSRNSYTFTNATSATNFGSISVWDFTMNSTGLFLSRTGNVTGNWTIGGNLTIGNGTVYLGSSGSGYGTTSIAGNLNLLGGTFDMDATTGAVSVTGNVSISSGATLKLSTAVGGDLNVAGNWTNSGTFTPSTRIVQFNGTTAQTLTGTTTFDYFKINNTNGLTLINPITVNTNLDLTLGKITLGTNNLTLGSAATATNASATSYVVTNSTGALVKNSLGNTATALPVGLAASYTPLTVTNTGTTNNISLVVASPPSNAVSDATKIVNLEWNLNSAGTGSVANVVFNWNASNQGASYTATGTGELGNYTTGPNYTITNIGTMAGQTKTVNGITLTSGNNKLVLGNTNAVYAVPPSNDNCSGATAIVLDAAAVTGNVTNATQSLTSILCNGNTGTANDDVWYSFTTTSAGTYTITVVGSASFDAVVDVRSGACNGTNIFCADATASGGTETISATGLSASTTYYIRVYDYGTGVPTTKTFTIAVTSPPPTLVVSPTSLAFSTTQAPLSQSASQSFNLSGSQLTGAPGVITVNAPNTDFQVSNDDTTWGPSTTISYSSSVLSSTPVYVRFTPQSTGAKSGNITFSGGGVSTPPTVAVTGTSVIAAPVATAATEVLPTGFTANWNAVSGTTSYRLDVSLYSDFQNPGSPVTVNEGFTSYTSGTSFNGFTLPASASSYNSTASSGPSGPNSVQLNTNNTSVTTQSFSGAITQFSFWLRNNSWASIVSTNYMLVEGFNGTSWVTIQSIPSTSVLNTSGPSGGSTFTYNSSSSPALPSNITQVRLTFFKTSGNVALDDFNVTYNTSTPSYVSGYQDLNVGNVTSYAVTGLSPETTYYYRVRAVNGSVASANSNVINVTTKPTSCTWNGTAWSNTTGPDADIEAIIAGVYSTTANGEFIAKKVTVNSGSLTINSGDAITIVDELVNTLTAADVVVENNANLIQGGTSNSNSGSITVNRNSSALLRLDYTLWSSPVASQNLLSFSPNTLTNRFYTYDTNTNLYSTISSPSTTSFDTAKGYLIRVPNNHPAVTPTAFSGVFSGVPNNGNITFTMVDGGAGQRFNAVGNPYPSPIDAVDFVNSNSNITGTLYFWRKTNNAASQSYCTWTTGGFVSNNEAQVYDPNDVIQTGQGFFVEANGSGTSLSFDNSMRVDNHANQFFRTANSVERNRIWLNVTNDAGLFCQTMIGYIENATNGFDTSIDGRYINDGEVALTTTIDNVDYAIQGKALPFDATDVVPLKLMVTTAGNYTISLDHVDGLFSASQDIFLRDNQTGFVQDLKAGNYTFTSDAGTFASRFDVIYQSPLGVENPSLNNQLVVYNNGVGEFVVNSGSIEMKSIKVFDLRGRLLNVFDNINSTQTKVSGGNANGVLLLQITSTDGAVVTKKVIR